MSASYSFIEISDSESEPFSKSSCECSFCQEMHASTVDWDVFTPSTNLQKRMKKIINKIEKRPRI
jgi:hypothetical protein